MKTDIQIAQEATLKPITEIAAGLGLGEDDISLYGKYKAKIDHRLAKKAEKQGKLILVTAISPTPAGEGKTTISCGLADALNALGKKTMLCLRDADKTLITMSLKSTTMEHSCDRQFGDTLRHCRNKSHTEKGAKA